MLHIAGKTTTTNKQTSKIINSTNKILLLLIIIIIIIIIIYIYIYIYLALLLSEHGMSFLPVRALF